MPYCRYLAHMYMGEALVALDKIADGIQHLNPELVTDIATTLPEQKLEQGIDKLTPMYSLFAICIDKNNFRLVVSISPWSETLLKRGYF